MTLELPKEVLAAVRNDGVYDEVTIDAARYWRVSIWQAGMTPTPTHITLMAEGGRSQDTGVGQVAMILMC
jgi:hypothetical protein